jgi:alpha/beta superfamily hydrolase
MKNLILALLIVFSNNIMSENSFLISHEKVSSYSKKDLKSLWKSKKIPKFIMPVKYGVDVYEIIYKVEWIDGTFRNASGIYFVPKTDKAVPYVMYGHGTQLEKKREISQKDAQQNICMMFATDGYAAMFPDYHGIGKGEGRHLYQHAWSEAMSYIYMLYAVDELNKELGIKNNEQLFLTGYSQGGHSSMAAHKYLEELNDPRFKVTASSPMSGAYDMTGDQAKYMFQEYPRPFYLPYLLISYQEAYKIVDTDNIYTIFKSPYDTILPKYFEVNETKTLDNLNTLLPKIPKDVVKDSFVNEFLNSDDFAFKQKLAENNLTTWKPKAPVQLCYCKGDKEVSYKNSEVAYYAMKNLGVENVALDNQSDYLDHNTCAAFAVLSTKYYFNRFKKNGKNPKMKNISGVKKFAIGFVKRKEEKKYLGAGKDKAYI